MPKFRTAIPIKIKRGHLDHNGIDSLQGESLPYLHVLDLLNIYDLRLGMIQIGSARPDGGNLNIVNTTKDGEYNSSDSHQGWGRCLLSADQTTSRPWLEAP